MLSKNDFPYTLGGHVEQEEYKGFDIAIQMQRFKGITAYVIAPNKRILQTNARVFGDKKELFQWGRDVIDRHLQYKEQQAKENVVKRADYYKRKCSAAAMQAFSTAMYFSNIKGEEYNKAKETFEYELEREFNKIQ